MSFVAQTDTYSSEIPWEAGLTPALSEQFKLRGRHLWAFCLCSMLAAASESLGMSQASYSCGDQQLRQDRLDAQRRDKAWRLSCGIGEVFAKSLSFSSSQEP